MHSFLCLFTKQEFPKQQLCKNPSQVGQGGRRATFPHLRTKTSPDPLSLKPKRSESEMDFSLILGWRFMELTRRVREIGNSGN